jgi:methylenetetrahydrofolate reductase (NADPH)
MEKYYRSPEPPDDTAVLRVRFEIIPIRSVDGQLTSLPDGATVTVTSSPRFGVERTLEYADILAARGFNVVPHLSARQVVDDDHLNEIVAALRRSRVRDVFVIAGDDRETAGRFHGALDLLAAMASNGHRFERVGVACYPEGHPLLDDDALLAELRRKQPLADYLVSQICFDAGTTIDWLRRVREAGITLPIHLGVPGVVRRTRLLELSFRLGVGPSLRFLSKQQALGQRFLRRRVFRPDDVVDGFAAALPSLDLGIAGLHFFTFNEITQTVRWVRRRLQPDAQSEGSIG